MTNSPATLRALGVDVGEARIGLALSDELRLLAHPHSTIDAREPNAIARIALLIERENVNVAVIGLPRLMNGNEGPAAAKAREFAEKLRAVVADCEVRLVDERLSTVAAQRALHESGRNVKNSRKVIDQVAAQMILQIYLDSQNL